MAAYSIVVINIILDVVGDADGSANSGVIKTEVCRQSTLPQHDAKYAEEQA